MSNAIQFLEVLGRNPVQIKQSDRMYTEAVAMLNIAVEQRKALLARDVPALSRLLDGRSKMFCMIVAPDKESPADVPDDGQEDEQSDKEDEQSSVHRAD